MSNKNQPAFPMQDARVNTINACAGLTKRELFALGSLIGQRASEHHGFIAGEGIYELAVKDADALLAELAKGGDDE